MIKWYVQLKKTEEKNVLEILTYGGIYLPLEINIQTRISRETSKNKKKVLQRLNEYLWNN